MRLPKSFGFYFAIGCLIVGILLVSELVPVRKESIALGPSQVHKTGKFYPIPFDHSLWKTDPQKAKSILLGSEIFYQTPRYAPRYVGNALSCTSCHYHGGQEDGMLGLIGVARHYPRYDARAGKEIDLQERIQSCFSRSLNGTAPALDDPLLLHLADYLQALSPKSLSLKAMNWENFVSLPKAELIPIAQLNPLRGQKLYLKNCAYCHMPEGQGDQWAPPLWGENSFNDGAGLARVYSLASFLKTAMPLSDPGSLSSQDAQQIAAFIDAQARPTFAGKPQDYLKKPIPEDAVYYLQKYPENPLRKELAAESIK